MIDLTEGAAVQINKLIADRGLPDNSGVRFAVMGGGCSGFEYHVDLEKPSRFELKHKRDTIFVSYGVRIIVDDKSLMFLDGSTVDWRSQNLGYSFVFNNPNSTGTCGCGVSFSI
jgi:iron-sulfur cluster assembly accessory protein